MRTTVRTILASLVATGLALGAMGHATTVHAGVPALRIVRNGQSLQLLAPGASFTATVRGIGTPRSGYCLGLISMQDRSGIPVSLGAFQLQSTGLMTVQATVPTGIFPTLPSGAFLLFAGRCTNVAPDGIYASAMVNIVQAAG